MTQRERWVVYPMLFFCLLMVIQARGCPPGAEQLHSKSLTTDHITIAYGRDYGDVSPIQGVLVGGGDRSMTVSVDVAPIQPAESSS